MAVINGPDYDHIDVDDGTNVTRHNLKDTTARQSLQETNEFVKTLEARLQHDENDYTINVQTAGTGYIDSSTGNVGYISDSNSYSYSEYINIAGFSSISYNQVNLSAEFEANHMDAIELGMAFYDFDKNYISGEIHNTITSGTSPYTYTKTNVPENAVYARFTMSTTSYRIAGTTLASKLTSSVGNLSTLTTNTKTSIVAAINEIANLKTIIGDVFSSDNSVSDEYPIFAMSMNFPANTEVVFALNCSGDAIIESADFDLGYSSGTDGISASITGKTVVQTFTTTGVLTSSRAVLMVSGNAGSIKFIAASGLQKEVILAKYGVAV